ncbi:Aspartate/methionine/tyrosine aminotransferase [Cyclonatronum proteinivorum]|uniref:alanine transaminase n=1 Tax=Cyclonatronum proteinivorum TaxID=1457365 RepID=A0A345UMC0_9BACT|nr:pyridoxal phosphate-dependent aminotransferase [Cyclonatronum proteinivorum]AXJ01622.1 Aspartate/methionine/tyrosine aminotransferase [Cyclonatronum proteinivorum]
MRLPLVPSGKKKASYEIRGIVDKGFQLQACGKNVFWENIGDPVQKGMKVPAWMKQIVANEALRDESYGYCESKGVAKTREFLASRTNAFGGVTITSDDITFFNGLGDAIARVYGMLSPEARVLMPAPTYPAHSGAESNRIGQAPLQYTLDPKRDWLPDADEIRSIVAANPDVCAILLINPDNPTGKVFPYSTLAAIVQIAREFDLFIICDEIYENLVYEGEMVRLCEVIGEVPAIAMKGISKEFPWPGSRCGWLEYYNRDKDPAFADFCGRIDHGKMTEVCSTSLPQRVIPAIMSHPLYQSWQQGIKDDLRRKMSQVREAFHDIDGFHISGGGGAFYATVHIDCDFAGSCVPYTSLNDTQLNLIRKWLKPGAAQDYKIVYYLLAVHGICVVPLSGFSTPQCGFRFTLLEQDSDRFKALLEEMKAGLSLWSQHRKLEESVVA